MKIIIVLLGFFCFSSFVVAEGQSALGKNKSVVCSACHGQAGVSTNPLWPNIAGQHARYLAKQLHDFQEHKTREAPTMTNIVAGLTAKDIDDLAAFYAKEKHAEGSTLEKYLKRGERLYRGGDFSKHITACIACHGPKGTGNAEAGFPMLAGQQPEYTFTQLKAFKNKTRRNDLNQIMQDICARMDDADMLALAHYVAGLY